MNVISHEREESKEECESTAVPRYINKNMSLVQGVICVGERCEWDENNVRIYV